MLPKWGKLDKAGPPGKPLVIGPAGGTTLWLVVSVGLDEAFSSRHLAEVDKCDG